MSLPAPAAQSITALLQSASAGDSRALDQVFSAVYEELRRLAAVVRSGRASETYDATALVHEAYLKLVRSKDLALSNRAHFMSVAARAMRQVLVDRAAERNAQKRGGPEPDVTLSDSLSGDRTLSPEELLDLDEALKELAEESSRAARVVECRFFGGMNADETAAALDISAATVAREWRFARAWLGKRLKS